MALPLLANLDLFENLVDDIGDGVRAIELLAGASTKVRAFTGRPWVDPVGDPETFTTNNAAIWETLQTVTIAVAERAWRNPTGLTQETTGPYSASYGPQAADGLYLTDGDRDDLRQALAWARGTARPPGLWTIRTTRGEGDMEDLYSDVLPVGEPIPMINLGQPW